MRSQKVRVESMRNKLKCGACPGTWAFRSRCQTVSIWLLVLFVTTLFTLLFIMCFIHFLKNNHTPPIVPNDLQDYSTTKSIYFLLSFYFLLWTVVYLGCTIFTVISKKSGHSHSDKPGKTLLIVLLILLAIITFLLLTIDRAYSPWIFNFLQGKIFSYCVQVAALITITVGVCYLFATLTMGLCSTKKGAPGVSVRMVNSDEAITSCNCNCSRASPLNKNAFANPCYNVIEFSLNDTALVSLPEEARQGVGNGITQV